MTSKESRSRALTVDARSTNDDLIDGESRSSTPHRIWLRPPELREKEQNREAASDPAEGIPRLPPGMKPKTGMKRKTSTKPKQPRPTMYTTPSASPASAPAGNAVGED